ncbi:MAG TPA: hypothetical protein VF762_14730 [Blastocatellia bacterium]
MGCQGLMGVMQEARTIAVKACALCSGGLLEYDRFCRWCGVRQPDRMKASGKACAEHLTDSINLSPYITSALERADAKAGLYRRVSGPLVNAVVAGVSANTPQACSRFGKRAILALISIPVWLIIILLSPLDAYAAAKNLLREN